MQNEGRSRHEKVRGFERIIRVRKWEGKDKEVRKRRWDELRLKMWKNRSEGQRRATQRGKESNLKKYVMENTEVRKGRKEK